MTLNTTAEPMRLGMADLDWATTLLTEAFREDPTTRYLFEGSKREQRTEYFMRCTCAYTLHFGEGYATPERDAVALWLLPGNTEMTPGRMYRAGMFAAPLKFGLGGFKRFMNFAGHTDKIHKAAAPLPHYYLFAMGVHPSAQGKGRGSFLLERMLERIDREKMPAYLEVQNERNLALYRRFGFEVAGEGEFPGSNGHYNWGMLRPGAH